MDQQTIIATTKLRKVFKTKKAEVEAVKGVTLEVKKGKIFGFLGPNGAGKTTTLQMLTTLLTPTSGTATIAGFDLLKNPQRIREHIGYVSQQGGADTSTNAVENLMLQARLYGISKTEAKKRTAELMERFELSEFADRKVTSYSGGQKRRLDLALGTIHKPLLIFLDEPTTGLDPQSRVHFWKEIESIKDDGTTIFLTTHYLDEADNLCDYVAIVDHGTIVAEGSPETLKKQTGEGSISIGITDQKTLEKGKTLMEKQKYVKKLYTSDNKLHIFVADGGELLPEILRFMDKNAITIQTIELSKPTLDDVFLQHTGRSLREGGEA
jgi:ABC-2 type transport system ATP-binding protein